MIFNFVFCVGSDFSIFKIFKADSEDLSILPFRVLSVLRTKYYELFNSYIIDNISVNIPDSLVQLVGYFDDKLFFTSLLDSEDDVSFKFSTIDNFKNLNNSFNHSDLQRSKVKYAKDKSGKVVKLDSDKDVKKYVKSMKGVKNEVQKN